MFCMTARGDIRQAQDMFLPGVSFPRRDMLAQRSGLDFHVQSISRASMSELREVQLNRMVRVLW